MANRGAKAHAQAGVCKKNLARAAPLHLKPLKVMVFDRFLEAFLGH